jgi:glutamate--cysteine ligase
MRELSDISEKLGIAWLGLGFHPLARNEDLAFVPKLRYGVMQKYLPTRGENGLDMMLRTCTVQANLDYASEEDAIRKLRVSLRLQPIVTAMFANSPFVEGKITGERSHRARVWLDVDNDRAGLFDFAWDESPMGYRRYIEWALDVPMFLVKRDGKIVHNTGQTFRSLPRRGLAGRARDQGGLGHARELALPGGAPQADARDAWCRRLPTDLVCALPALWKGLLYEDHARASAEALASKIRLADAKAARPEIAERALRAKLGDREVGEYASEVLRIAGRPRAPLEPQQERRGRAHPPRPPRVDGEQGPEPCGRAPREVRPERAPRPPAPPARALVIARAPRRPRASSRLPARVVASARGRQGAELLLGGRRRCA